MKAVRTANIDKIVILFRRIILATIVHINSYDLFPV